MSPVAVENPRVATSPRLISLDVLRGITIAFMILVNNGGEYAYWPLKHSDWNGWTPTDLVFPTFLFLMGTSLVFSFESRLGRGASRQTLALHTVRRFAILFLLGLVVNGFPFFHLATLRIYGVLQRIAICFLVCSFLYLWDRRVASKVVLVVAALLGYWALMRLVPVPGYGVPGRDIPFLDKNANIVAWLDRHIFPGRLYEGVRDPEGLLSNIPAFGTTLLGMLTAMWLRTKASAERKCAAMFGAGVVLILLGELWNPWFPINEKLGPALMCCLPRAWRWCALRFAIWRWKFAAGKRDGPTTGWSSARMPLAPMFSRSCYRARLIPSGCRREKTLGSLFYLNVFQRVHPGGGGALLYAIAFVMVCWMVMLVLYRKRIFIKV